MLLQPDFALALLQLAKSNGFTTAVESTGFAPFETIEKLLPYIDTYLLDVKHMNPEKHKEYISKDNARVLENAVKIAKAAKKCIVRVPTIPGFNDSEEEIRAIAEFAYKTMGVDEINLLPYHNFGKDKYDGLGREYLMGDVAPPTEEKMKRLCEICENVGLKAKIGG